MSVFVARKFALKHIESAVNSFLRRSTFFHQLGF